MVKKLSISEISANLKLLRDKNELHLALINELKCDSRKGVQNLIQRELKFLDTQKKIAQRLKKMMVLENSLTKSGYNYIAGVDEAGRGPLAGPVVASAVILPKNFKFNNMLDDSKKISESKREFLYHEIVKSAIDVSVSMATPVEIDEINILNASLLAMYNSVCKLSIIPDIVLVDGNKKIPSLSIQQRAIIKGDANVRVIAAASIIAKVYRDKVLNRLNDFYPDYEFLSHKGYPTVSHREKIKHVGLSPIHRKSFNWGQNE